MAKGVFFFFYSLFSCLCNFWKRKFIFFLFGLRNFRIFATLYVLRRMLFAYVYVIDK